MSVFRDTKIEMDNPTLRMGDLFEVEGAINITENFYANSLTEKEVNSKRKEEFKKKLETTRETIFFLRNETSMPYGVFYTNKEKDNLVVVVGQIFQIKDDFDEEIHPKYINSEGKEVEDEKLNIAKPKNRIYCYGSLGVYYWSDEIDFDTSALIYDDKIKRKVYLESASNPSIGRRRSIDTKMEEWLSKQGRYFQDIEQQAQESFEQEILDELMDKFRNYCISINPMADTWRYTRAYLEEDVFEDDDYYTDVDLLFTKEPKDKEGEKRAKELEDSLTKEQRKIHKKYKDEFRDLEKIDEWNNSKRVIDIKKEIYFLKKRNKSLDLNTEPLDDEELKFIKTKYPIEASYIYIAVSPTARCFFVLNHQLEFLLVDVKVDTYTQSTTLQDLVLQLI
tara:strand:- start:3366 stop:4544 length:1179 start_codon:yes stop_codon:yes gene_type:complete